MPRYLDAAPNVADRDPFILSGVEDLVPLGVGRDERGCSVARYRPRTEGLFAEILHYADASAGSDHWRVRSKQGHRAESAGVRDDDTRDAGVRQVRANADIRWGQGDDTHAHSRWQGTRRAMHAFQSPRLTPYTLTTALNGNCRALYGSPDFPQFARPANAPVIFWPRGASSASFAICL
ncbi:SpvB/TcaC N-terminal domain-containing protein [Bradyrhizobium sp. Ec3.3]|uniref:SpvB/TcaC N-terminal domain-containing protein n=1 Tax=Bradyrhizobium sp. Ec3.3 TaxID=189753 RepID=UPI003526F162